MLKRGNCLSRAGKVAAGVFSIAMAMLSMGCPQAARADYPNFYGACAHYDFNQSPSWYVSYCNAHGLKNIRIDAANVNQAQAACANVGPANSTYKVLAVLNLGYNSSQSESVNYTNAYNAAVPIVQQFAAYGVTTYECGNEMTTTADVFPRSNYPGLNVGDYSPTGWPAMRGTMRGMIDAVHHVNSSFRAGIDFCINQTAASDMLWFQGQPNGSGGVNWSSSYPAVRWDVTMWHNYQVYGDLFNLSNDNHFNLIQYIHNQYGKPIMITEWNSTMSADTDRAGWTSQFLSEYYQNRNTYNIEATFFYMMGQNISTDSFGLDNPNWPQQTAAFTNFTSEFAIGNAQPIANGTYTMTPGCATGSLLDANGGGTVNGTKVQIYQANRSPAQWWAFTYMGNGLYKIQPSYNTGLCLDVNGAYSADGTVAQLWQDNAGSAQRWMPIRTGYPNWNGSYKFTPVCAPGSMLDVQGGWTANGTQVQIYHDNGATAQQWWVGN